MIENLWYKSPSFINYLLLPVAWLFHAITNFRYFLYKSGIKRTYNFPAPIIIVGNINIGGTGKTPLVIWLAKLLIQQGYRPGIISRGYGAKKISQPKLVTANCLASEVGDEPLMIAKNVNCPIAISPKRAKAISLLLNKQHNCNVIISDDGLQHYAINHDIEIAVIDAQRKFGNGFLFPAGPLREPIKRLQQVDFIINNCNHQTGNLKNKSTFNMKLNPNILLKSVANSSVHLSISKLLHKPIHAIAGIGNPQRFFTTLKQLGLQIIEHPFPDHYNFKEANINFGANEIVIMTEKDAIKCASFTDDRHWYLPISAELDERFTLAILKKLAEESL